MSWHTNQLKYALGLGSLVTFYGLVSLIIFVAGSRFGVSLSYQIVIVAIVLLTLPFALVISFVGARRKRKRELAAQKEEESKRSVEENGAQPPAQKISAPAGRYEELNNSANTAFQFLQSSNLAGDAKGKDALYALPFFLFAGTPRSGKSSLVLSSNFNFQTLPNQRQSEQNFLRPTRHADWRVSSEAVLIDTAGRYQTEAETDEDEWAALIEILKKQRGLRPLDGLVLVANAEKLINADETEIEHQAKLLRARLDDAMQRAKVRFPVYLVFANADAIEGFRDSFSVSQREGKSLLLGATFPLEKAMNGAHAIFDSEFEALQNGLLRRRLLRLSAPFPPIRQLRIFNFPAHFSSSRRKLGHFVATLFRPNPFSESPIFRGFYFTANLPNNNTVGTSYFSERFFRDVLLRDKDLVAAFQAQKQRPPVLGWILLGVGALLTIFLLAMSGISVYFNRQLVNDATARGARVREMNRKDAGKNPLAKDAGEKEVDLNTLEELRRSLKTLDDYNRNRPPFYMRFGMYSGDKLFLGDRTNKGLFGIYADAVEQRFKKPMIAELVADLQKFAQSQPVSGTTNEQQEAELERNYKLLKAYLMLTEKHKDKAEATFLNEQFKPYWKEFSKNAPRLEATSEQQLAFFASQVDRPEFEAIAHDEQLVNAARQRLRTLPAWVKQYNTIISNANKKIDPVGLENVLVGNRFASLLQSGGHKVPGSFTLNGYRQEIYKSIANAREVLIQPDWVMDETAPNEAATDADVEKLKNRYFTEYTEQWRKFIQSVEVAPYNNSKEQAEAALRDFASAESPINLVLNEIARNTNLTAKPNDWWSYLTSFFGPSEAEKTAASSIVVKQYNPLFAFIGKDKPGSNNQQTALANYQSSLGNLGRDLANRSQETVSKDLIEKEGKGIGLKGKETEIEGYLSSLSTAETKEIADLLKQPLDNLKAVFGADIDSQIRKAWTDQLLPRAVEIERGFPFTDAGEADLPKLTAYLNNADGALSVFYRTKLQKYFDEVGGQIKLKESSQVKFDPEFVNYLNNAFRMRDALYGKGATPNFEYDVTLQPVKDAIVELSIDGNKIDSEGTRSGKFTFPARAGQETGVVLQLVSTASPPIPATNPNLNTNSSANVSTSNVNTATNANSTSNFAQTNNSSAANAPLRFPGQWGVFRMLQEGGAQRRESGEYVLNLKVGNKIAVVTIRPTGGDIFNREIFRSVRAPQSILR